MEKRSKKALKKLGKIDKKVNLCHDTQFVFYLFFFYLKTEKSNATRLFPGDYQNIFKKIRKQKIDKKHI